MPFRCMNVLGYCNIYMEKNCPIFPSRSLTRENLVDYINSHYKAPRMVLAAAGGGLSSARHVFWMHIGFSTNFHPFHKKRSSISAPPQVWTTRSWSVWPSLTSVEFLLSMREMPSPSCLPADLQAVTCVAWERISILWFGWVQLSFIIISLCLSDPYAWWWSSSRARCHRCWRS